jgi:hypothetical protein
MVATLEHLLALHVAPGVYENFWSHLCVVLGTCAKGGVPRCLTNADAFEAATAEGKRPPECGEFS